MKLAARRSASRDRRRAAPFGRRLETPAAVAQTLRREIGGVVADLDAVLRVSGEPAERAALNLAFEALIGEAVFHLQIDRPAQRIEAEHRIVGPQIGAVDGVGRDQIPVDRVAERLVEADAAHVNRDALRRALHRRRKEAAIAELLRGAVAVGIGQRDTPGMR